MSDSTYFALGEYIEDAMYEDYADKLYKLTRVSVETWMNLQKRYGQRKKD